MRATISRSYAVIVTGEFQKRLSTYGREQNKDANVLLTSDSTGTHGITHPNTG